MKYKSMINIEDQLTSILSEELAKEIDKSILQSFGFEMEKNKRRSKKIKRIISSE